MTERTFKVTADEQDFPGNVLRRLAEHLGGEGIPDEDWWVKVDFGQGPETVADPRLVVKGFGQIREALEHELRQATYVARKAGLSWAAIAEQLGVSKQAAQKRYG